MATLVNKPTYHLELTRDELRVIGWALVGEWEKVQNEALALHSRLLEARRRCAQEELELVENIMQKYENENDGPK